MVVNKSDFVEQLVEKYNYTKGSAMALVNDFWELMIENMGKGNDVQFYGCGRFELSERAERSCPNPQTGEKCVIPSHYVIKFYPGNGMKRVVKEWEDNNKRGLV